MGIQFDEKGREIPDPRPLELAANAVRPESLQSMMQRMIRQHLSQVAADQGHETFEEANDFDVEEEDFDDPLTQYEEMGLELDTARETEEGSVVRGDNPTAEPAGLRTVGDRPPAGTGGRQESVPAGVAARHPGDAVPAQARAAGVPPNPAGTAPE